MTPPPEIETLNEADFCRYCGIGACSHVAHALRSLAAERQWRPIETCPEKEPCLVYCPKNERGRPEVYMVGGRFEQREIEEMGGPVVTKWQPLPAAPTEDDRN